MQSQQYLSQQVIVETRSNQQERDQVQLYDRGVISILKNEGLSSLLTTRPPFRRTEKQCRTIADYLKVQPYFETIAKNYKLLLQISSWIEYRSVQSGEYIYHLHDATDSFYILMSGEVHLTYPEKEVQEEKQSNNEEDQHEQTLRQKKDQSFYPTAPQLVKNQSNGLIISSNQTPRSLKRLTKHLSLYGNQQMMIELPKPKKLALQQRIVQMIAKGESFGDSLGDSTRRRTNAVAKEESQLLIIRKQHFPTIAKANSKSQGRIKYQFIAALPLFKHVSRYSLQSIVYLMEQVKINYNGILYSEEQAIKYIFIPFKGEFKLYKKVKNSKQICKELCTAQQKRIQMRNVSFKVLELGQTLGLLQCHQKITTFQEACVCKSQQGVVLRVEKNKFMKKLLSSENSIEQIIPYLQQKIAKKALEVKIFLQKFQQSHLFVRYLNTPSGRSRRTKTQSTAQRMRSEQKGELRRLSTATNNFFNELNKTVNKEVRSTRISIKRSSNFFPVQRIPNRIKDIIGIVHQQSNYFDIRKPKQDITLFEFNISKVPIHVKKKYELLFKKQKV